MAIKKGGQAITDVATVVVVVVAFNVAVVMFLLLYGYVDEKRTQVMRWSS